MENNMGLSASGLKTMQLNDQKAGMQGLDKEMINKIIYESSKDSPYFAFQEKRQKSIDSKVAELNSSLKKITEQEKAASFEKMTKLAEMFEFERDLSHSIVHIDMDAFYAAVEMKDNPQLKEKPMAVGSSSMLSTSNYLARRFGVRAAMPGFIAKKLCPNLTIVPCNFDKYRKESSIVKSVIKEYDPEFSAAGLDEFYLDLTEYIKAEHKKQLHKNFCLKNSQNENYKECLTCCQLISTQEKDQLAYDIVEEIRKKIYDVTSLTASAGIAPNTLLAKVCSDQNKPNGQYQIPSSLEAVHDFVSTLQVKKVSGIGPVQGQILNAIGIHTCGDLWDKRDIVGLLFSNTSVDFYMRVAIGIGSTTVKSDYVRKSIGTEHTFKEMNRREELLEKCQELCEEVVEDLMKRKLLGKVVVLKYKTTAFISHTRNHSLAFHSSDKDIIIKAAKKLLEAEIAAVAPKPLRLRLMGIRMATLVFEGEVPSIEKHLVKIKDFLKPTPMNQTVIESEKCCDINSADSIEDGQLSKDPELIISDCINKESQNGDSSKCGDSNLLHLNASGSKTDIANYFCPVCNFNQNVSSLEELNIHIDNCLNKVTIKEILSEEQNLGKRKLHQNEKVIKKLKTVDKACKKIKDYFH